MFLLYWDWDWQTCGVEYPFVFYLETRGHWVMVGGVCVYSSFSLIDAPEFFGAAHVWYKTLPLLKFRIFTFVDVFLWDPTMILVIDHVFQN